MFDLLDLHTQELDTLGYRSRGPQRDACKHSQSEKETPWSLSGSSEHYKSTQNVVGLLLTRYTSNLTTAVSCLHSCRVTVLEMLLALVVCVCTSVHAIVLFQALFLRVIPAKVSAKWLKHCVASDQTHGMKLKHTSFTSTDHWAQQRPFHRSSTKALLAASIIPNAWINSLKLL